MMTLFLARIFQNPDLWDKFGKFLIFAEYSNNLRPLLDHEEKYLVLLKEQFPNLDYLLSPRNFLRLKSMVNLNSFSVATHAVNFSLSESSVALDPMRDLTENHSTLSLELAPQHVTGSVMYKLGSLINHSCSPNIELSYPSLSTRATWIAKRPIKQGEELTCCYVPFEAADESAHVRRAILWNLYNFDCKGNCEACLETENILEKEEE